ncbi:EAL domain-containing protein [Oscillibacter sp. MSJ-2]|uniref:EAL domain-containing protein n=1 Tax=Dysosmobacter acutus TaxID=2841504 RepID=A0ABS6FBB0_9FIRM|nr:EAL domain-containing protein [Dysosmobacter acutus]MBU5626650.1 EAL domain-containing protein [Dysosmobacter acutus]
MKKSRSVFRTILIPLILILLLEACLLLGGIRASGVVDKLDQNAGDILSKQAENRRGYLEGSMVGTWSDLSLLAADINETTRRMLSSGEVSLETLDSKSEECAQLVLNISDELITTLYSKKVSGIFVVFNTRDLDGKSRSPRTGFYIRDLDPASTPSYRNADLLLERAPIAVVKGLNISTDNAWQPLFNFEEEYPRFLYDPFQAAFHAEEVSNAQDYGYWNPEPYILPGDDRWAVSYSIPLILEDGTIYGVLGVDLLTDYLKSLLPSAELFDDKQGSYLLAVEEDGRYTTVLSTGPILPQNGMGETFALEQKEDGHLYFDMEGERYFAAMQPLNLYNSNTPFAHQRWVLIGAVREDQLYSFSNQVLEVLTTVVLMCLAAGLLGSVLVSRRLSAPIRELSEEVALAQRDRGGLPQLSHTGITEIDRFSGAITNLSREVLDASTKFLRIMEMASVEMGGFELRQNEDLVYVTDNFFPLMGLDDILVPELTVQRFRELMEERNQTLEHHPSPDGSELYRIPVPRGGVRYLRYETTREGERHVGLVEDVTASTLERLRIEHERDYDLLTGLYNRPAFQRTAAELFAHPETLKHAAMIMLDLDNLKTTNDRFGHDWGDQYIRRAGQCFAANAPAGTLCARVSGDEFFLLYHGYESREEIREAIRSLREAIRGTALTLPSGEVLHISASGGVAWYPEDSTSMNELTKFADFAMYQVKQSRKGELADFDLGVYSREEFLLQNKREFHQFIEQELVTYFFQPIVSAKTGRAVAYEALMRVDLPTLRSPEAVLRIAREEGKLSEIERMTWYKASEAFCKLQENQLVTNDSLLFLNSIANQCMSQEDWEAYKKEFLLLQPRVVVEITESEHLDQESTRAKRRMLGVSGMFALDDYGSGYNSEKNLLELTPQFIKVDISIIRDIDTDRNKQQIVANIVAYAHEREMYIIAEGLETAAEVKKVLDLDVDLLQGYYLARPAAVPPQISQAAVELLRSHSGK